MNRAEIRRAYLEMFAEALDAVLAKKHYEVTVSTVAVPRSPQRNDRKLWARWKTDGSLTFELWGGSRRGK